MSSENSTTTSSSRLSQFGIYRSIDARTEEFLRLSRKRQIRQGCACAAVSTAITVTIVVVILLIYEYAIVVESNLVQNLRSTNATDDKPVADRLDRSFFGFDQDYYERMPLLVNAMQENSYIDPAADSTSVKSTSRNVVSKPTPTTLSHRTNSIRRTSPRPFYFEFKSPAPTPFSKTYGSRSWVDSYRNAQRLKNLQQVIQYLEKTINAKFGDLNALPTSTIAFSGLYVEPTISYPKGTSPTAELLSQGSHIVENYKSNHQQDPLYSYKPDTPGDVNLLADGFFRFSPAPTPISPKETFGTSIPMFRPITQRKRTCIGLRCIVTSESKIITSQESSDYKEVETTSYDKPKSFSVLLNLFPLKPNNLENRKSYESQEATQIPINKIYITTSRPTVQFRRKSTTPIRRATTRIMPRPRLLPKRKIFKTTELNYDENRKPVVGESKMIVHVNVYPTTEIRDQVTTESNIQTTTTSTTTSRYSTPIPMLTSTQVEDYHVGSSGIIPPEARLTPAPPPPLPTNIPTLPTSTLPFFDTFSSSTELNLVTTNPPEILKFGHEDAKIPEHYKKMLQLEDETKNQPDINRRNSNDSIEINEDYEMETRTLLARLKNNNTQTKIEKFTTENPLSELETTKTYVPQINGHYRSVNQNSKNINTWLDENTPVDRKKKLEIAVTGFRKSTYVPQYVEIKRNNTRNPSDEE